MSLSLTPQCPEPGHMIIPSCRESLCSAKPQGFRYQKEKVENGLALAIDTILFCLIKQLSGEDCGLIKQLSGEDGGLLVE